METFLAVAIGVLYAGGVYMMLRRSMVKLIIGLILISHASNLLIFTVGGLTRGRPPLVSNAQEVTTAVPAYADPVPQALILTAIVISFGVLAFLVVLVHRAYQSTGTDDMDDLTGPDR
jgi:multicomponent Na+:H+ antiporter subunit C